MKLVKVSKKKSPVTLKKKRLINHIAFVLDRSASMDAYTADVIKNFNLQIKEVLAKAKETGQETRVSLVTFSTEVDAPVFFNAPVEQLGELTRDSYKPNGWTALLDAVGDTIELVNDLSYITDDNTSVLLIVVTDGEENRSIKYDREKFQDLVRSVQATDRWTLAFMGPPGCKNSMVRLGIPEGNIKEWEGAKEFKTSSVQTLCAIGNYYGSRSRGLTSSDSFYTPQVAGLSPSLLQANLVDARNNFRCLSVSTRAPVELKKFMVDHGLNFVKGRSFYELTKKEKVQAYKEFCILDRTTGAIYTGPDARSLLRIPAGGTIELNPSFSSRYGIFVLSTSSNRKLIPGTKVLYMVTV